MRIRYFLFLSLGLNREYLPPQHNKSKDPTEWLLEPDGARNCRRNILALATAVVLTGLAGVDPSELRVFGVSLSGDHGVVVLGLAVVLAHLYWYFLRYFHIRDDGTSAGRTITHIGYPLVRRGADLLANYVAIIMTLSSWCFVASWLICPQ